MAALANRLRGARRDFGDVVRNPDLRRLQLAWAFSIVATWAYSVGVVVFAYAEGGAAAVGIVGLLRWVAAGVISPFAALLADRYDRRHVMIASDLLRAALIVVAAVSVGAGAGAPVVYVLATLVSVAGTPFRPAEAALTPQLVRTPEELGAANVIASAIESTGIFVGPALGGLLLAATSVATTFFVTAAGVLVSALFIARITRRADVTDDGEGDAEGIREELLVGVRAIFGNRSIALLVALFGAQTFVDGLLGVLIAVVALDYLSGSAATVGWLNAASGIGGIAGAAFAGVLVGRGRLAADFGLGVVLFGLPLALLAASNSLGLALVLLAAVGIGNTLADVSGMTLLQRVTPPAVVGRVFGVLESVLLLTVALGAAAAPILVSTLGTRGALVVAGVLLPALVVPSFAILRRMDDVADIPTERVDLLRRVTFFASLPEAAIERLARSAETLGVGAGETVVAQGEPGDRFYVVAAGVLGVAVDGKQVGTLREGDSFGEIALLRDVPRTASVRAAADTRLLALDRDDFVTAVTGYAPSLSSAEAVVGLRLGARA
ncbi:MAG: MFS transporter [Gaiellaceae bacterium]